jgi:hypothetical protein
MTIEAPPPPPTRGFASLVQFDCPASLGGET